MHERIWKSQQNFQLPVVADLAHMAASAYGHVVPAPQKPADSSRRS
ncbi:MAG: hypothetical protein ACI8XD_001882, partial [Thermoproteota archaeon]